MVAAESTEALGRAIADPSSFLTNAWLIAFLPAMSALLTLFLGKRTPGKGSVYGIAAVGASLVLSLGVLWTFVGGERGFYEASIPWFQIGQLHLEVGVYVDGLTAVMVVVVTSISLCVHIYSLGYMKGDVRFTWFYTVLSLFTSAMLVVVLANNLFQLLVGWEVMGVCSYLLIGHWWEDHVNSSSAIKAFITTRVGDVPFMFGIFVLISITGFTTSNIPAIGDVISHGGASVALVSAAALLLFGGTIGKSAQFPLHVWLPDAMAGPTPVSALIHAATMVAAGVYLVGRLFFVFTDADPVVLQIVGRRRRHHDARCGADGVRPGRHQARPRVLDDQPARVHGRRDVDGAGRSHRRVLPPVHARVLQGAPVPGIRRRDPRGPHEQHERDGRPAKEDAHHVLDVPDRLARARRGAARWPASGRRTSSWWSRTTAATTSCSSCCCSPRS